LAVLAFTLLSAGSQPGSAGEGNWPQFRGPDALGLAVGKGKLPVKFGPKKNVLWKTPLPAGMSSPCVWGQRIFLTGFDAKSKKLQTLCLDRKSGKVLWRKAAPATSLEKVHLTSSNATGTPATDGKHVCVYFGSYGLLCYDFEGKELWKLPLPTPKTRFGSGTSPILHKGIVLLKCQGAKGQLLALDARTGKAVWKKERLPFDPAYSLPLVRKYKDGHEVIIHGEGGVRAYDLKEGKERWALAGMFCAAIPTPIEAEGLLFFVAQFPGGDRDDPLQMPSFSDMLKKYDKNKDGMLDRKEVKDVILYSRDRLTKEGDIKLLDLFGVFDRNGDGKISRLEWNLARSMVGMMLRNALMAVRLEERDGKVKTKVVWREKNALPEVSSPLCYRGRLYTIKHGGILSCLQAKTGKVLFRKRGGSVGLYYASPVAGDGKIYLASARGVVTVLAAGDAYKLLARVEMEEPIAATPVLIADVLYLRTEKHLYAFKE
jgi:outer membrane protein assembly factor BamB